MLALLVSAPSLTFVLALALGSSLALFLALVASSVLAFWIPNLTSGFDLKFGPGSSSLVICSVTCSGSNPDPDSCCFLDSGPAFDSGPGFLGTGSDSDRGCDSS